MDETQKTVWLAGVMSIAGSLYVAQDSVHFVIKSLKHMDTIEVFADMVGSNLRPARLNKKVGVKVTISGEKLRGVMKRVWPYLQNDRRREYVEAVRKARGGFDSDHPDNY